MSASIGLVHRMQFPAYVVNHLAALVCGERLDSAFLHHYLLRFSPSQLIQDAAYPSIRLSDIATLKMQLPPIDEQRRIATILDKANALCAKRRKALAQLDRLAGATFVAMFGDPKFNPKGWKLNTIDSVTLDMRGGAALEPEDFIASGFPVLHKGAIKPGGQVETDSKKKAFADPVYARGRPQNIVNRQYVAVTLRDLVPSGPSIGLAADLQHAPQEEYLLAQGAYGVRLDPTRVCADYFVQLSNMPNFRHVLRQHAVGSTQIHIRNPVYLSIEIPIPPIEAQREFSVRMKRVRQLALLSADSLRQLNELFESLQHRAFRGVL